MEQLISDQFHRSIEAKIDHVEALTAPLEAAAGIMTDCLLNDGKLLVCADGRAEALANTLAHCMLNGQQLERPGLPTLVLNQLNHDINANDDPFSAQIRALSKPQDVLVLISPGPVSKQLLAAVSTAQQCGLAIVALSAPGHEALTTLLQGQKSAAELIANNDCPYRIHEIHMLILFCLCELIEHKLFGVTN